MAVTVILMYYNNTDRPCVTTVNTRVAFLDTTLPSAGQGTHNNMVDASKGWMVEQSLIKMMTISAQ